MKTFDAAVIATLVALCITTNYALVGVFNVKVMDFMVFIGGFCFGPFTGALIGILTWAVYGVMNPYGFVPQVWLATMFSESIYGVVGGLLGRNFASIDFSDQRWGLSVFFGAIGFLLTLTYDLITNIVYALTLAERVPIILVIISGTPFTLLHEVSNAAIFGVCSVPMVFAVRKIVGGRMAGFSKK